MKITVKELKQLIRSVILEQMSLEAYKWRPSASQRRAFADKMNDPEARAAYEKRKAEKDSKRKSTSKFDYSTAGGSYVPTKDQYDFVMQNKDKFVNPEEIEAMNQVLYGYTTNEKIHHDHIHIVNDKLRSSGNSY